LTVTRYPPNGGDDNDLPAIAELLSAITPNNVSASGNHNSDDDDGFTDVDELLAAMKKESISTSVEANSGGIAEADDNGIRGGSPVGSSRSTVGGTQGRHIVAFLIWDGLLI
jgi:hypothetical protein